MGAERLIVVAIDYRSTYVLRFVCWALRPATAAEGIGFHANSHLLSLPFDAANKPLQFYAGQPDPNDPSRFTIRYKLDGQLGTIEGWVDEGAGVSLAVKDGPAKER